MTKGYDIGNPVFEGKPVNSRILEIEKKLIEAYELAREASNEHMIEESLWMDIHNIIPEMYKQYKDKRKWGLVD